MEISIDLQIRQCTEHGLFMNRDKYIIIFSFGDDVVLNHPVNLISPHLFCIMAKQ